MANGIKFKMNFINKMLRSTTIDFKRKTFYLDFLFLFVCVWTLISSGSEVQYYLLNLLVVIVPPFTAASLKML